MIFNEISEFDACYGKLAAIMIVSRHGKGTGPETKRGNAVKRCPVCNTDFSRYYGSTD